uniref:PDZ domain-containing protein n=1 Tax=Rhodosorus marinus TaxID=101924 RepID=A0A7S3A3J4_9RHOD|mmetsp:Transcript_43399/g.169834  ORF Transcript_43399/g.169834 Transcript_43399/m.169834 type:complete len:375 (+) Transcript_43399:183-1307(+)
MIRVAPGLRCLSLLGPRIWIRGYQTASPGLLPGDRKGNGLLNAVVKVFSTQSTPDFSMPWQNKPHEYTTGSGFISRTPVGLRILTNAHLVADTTFVQVRKHGNSERFEASVEALAHECDVAMLNVEDQKFWANSDPLVLADEIPQLQDNISVIGYPTGGENLSVTSGVVSRIEMQQYTHAATSLLAVQIDAAINSGNSGGPAVKDGWVYGIAFQNLAGADGIGFVIPTPVIHHFLDSVNSKSGYQRFCDLEVKCQDMENDHLREYYGMKAHDSGVLINKIAPLSSVSGLLKPGDVLISFDDVAIANDGTVDHPITGRINFQHLVSMKKVGEIAMLGAIRDGKKIKLTAAMAAPNYLVVWFIHFSTLRHASFFRQ